MHVRIILTLLTVVLTSAASIANAQTKSDREKAGLVGAVKSVRESSYRYMGPTDANGGSRAETGDTVTFDAKGNEIEREMVSDFGEAMGKAVNGYDETGLLKTSKIVNAKGKIDESSAYSYSDRRLIQLLRYDGVGVLREKTVSSYDISGRLTEELYFDPDVARGKTLFRYDGAGREVVEMAFFLSDGTKAYAPVGPCLGAHRVTLQYDEKHRPITKAVYETDGKVKKSWTYGYNDRGNTMSVAIKTNLSSTSFTYTYEFDAAGNWIKRTSVGESSSNALELMLKATGKEVPLDELKRMNDSAKIISVTLRNIVYF